MNEEKLIAEIVTSSAKDILSTAFDVGSKGYKKAYKILRNSFKKYLESSYKQYSKTKTILYRDKAVPLEDFFIPLDLMIQDDVIKSDDIESLFLKTNNILITGTAGSGKSTMIKSIFLKFIEKKYPGIPILFELRNLNNNESSILERVTQILQKHDENFDLEQLHRALKKGKIILLLDGYDEINPDLRNKYEDQILDLNTKYPLAKVIVLSRPDEEFASWNPYDRYRIQKLSKEQSIKLVKKLDYDSSIKEKFLAQLEKDLYDKHESFLSNPLLLTIMLMTFGQIAEIPSKMHIFFNQAFDVLFNRHDALKRVYKRKFYTSLDVDEFKKVLSAFSYTTYVNQKINFLRPEAIEYLDKAKQVTRINYSSNDYFKDLIESLCMLVKDGLFYTFNHRSFQEYFTAKFLSEYKTDKKKELIERAVKNEIYDNILTLLSEINKEVLELEYVIPKIEDYYSEIKNLTGGKYKYIRNFRLIFSTVKISTSNTQEDKLDIIFSTGKSSTFTIFYFNIQRLYRDSLKDFYSKLEAKGRQNKYRKYANENYIPGEFINVVEPYKEIHDELLKLGVKEYVDGVNERIDIVYNHLKEKYKNREKSVDDLLLG